MAFQKVKLSSVDRVFFPPKILGRCFLAKLRQACMFLFFSSGFCCGTLPCMPVSFLWWNREHWPLLRQSESCRPLWALLWPRGWVVAAHSGSFWILLGSLSAVPCVRHLWNLRNKRLFLNLFQTDGSQVVSFSFLLEFPWLCVSNFRGPFGLLHLVRQILLERFLDWEHVWQ